MSTIIFNGESAFSRILNGTNNPANSVAWRIVLILCSVSIALAEVLLRPLVCSSAFDVEFPVEGIHPTTSMKLSCVNQLVAIYLS